MTTRCVSQARLCAVGRAANLPSLKAQDRTTLSALSELAFAKSYFLMCRRYNDLRIYEAVTPASTLLVEVARNTSPTSAAVISIGYSLKYLLQVNTP